MSPPVCCICQAATLVQRQAIHTLIPIAGVLDALLRQYSDKVEQQPTDHTPWQCLGDFLEVLGESPTAQLEGLAQGVSLAANIERHWLGGFESLCLNCGFMLMEDTGAG